MTPEDLAARLRDIRDIDPVSPWPPGPGWWLLALTIAVIVIFLMRYRPHRLIWQRQPNGDWRKSATAELRALRIRANTEDPKQIAGELSELVRRVAMARCGREACAGLSGKRWLNWLQEHDPHNFDWPNKGGLLASALYAPQLPSDTETNLAELIDAALRWSASDAKACSGVEEPAGV